MSEKIERVHAYILKNPDLTIAQIARGTGYGEQGLTMALLRLMRLKRATRKRTPHIRYPNLGIWCYRSLS